jgi:drug/metabolite transporter (DMT)-like permease
MQMIQKEDRWAGQGAILLCAILWSTSGLFIKLVDWHPMVIAGSRSILAAAFLFVLRRFFGSKIPPMSLREVPVLAVCGLCYAATMIFFVIANKLTASANAILIQYAAPVWAALLAWFFLKEKPHWENWCALVLVSMGMFMVFSGGLAAGSLLGDACALVSGIAFGANSVVLRAKKDGNPADSMFFAHIICVLCSLPFFFLYPPTINAHNLLCISFMGIVQIGVASALFAYGIRRIPAVQAMLTSAIEPVLNPTWVLLVTGERPTLSVISGGAVILVAILFSSILSALRRRN